MVYLSKPTTEIYPAVGCCNIPCSLPFSKPCTKLASKINYLASNCCNAQQDACQSKVLLMEDTSHDPKGKMSSDRRRALVRTQLLKLMCKGSETRTRSRDTAKRRCSKAECPSVRASTRMSSLPAWADVSAEPGLFEGSVGGGTVIRLVYSFSDAGLRLRC